MGYLILGSGGLGTALARDELARVNADLEGSLLEATASPDAEGRALLVRVAERFGLSARGYHRVLRVARTIADLDGSEAVRHPHIAEAVSFRLTVAAKG